MREPTRFIGVDGASYLKAAGVIADSNVTKFDGRQDKIDALIRELAQHAKANYDLPPKAAVMCRTYVMPCDEKVTVAYKVFWREDGQPPKRPDPLGLPGHYDTIFEDALYA